MSAHSARAYVLAGRPEEARPRLRKRAVGAPDDLKHALGLAERVNALHCSLTATATAAYKRVGLSLLEARLIYLLGRRPNIKAAEACKTLSMDAGALSRTLKELRDGNVVSETTSGRKLSLTERGWAHFQRVSAITEERERRLLAGIAQTQIDLALKTIDRMSRNTSALIDLVTEMEDVVVPERKASDT